MCMMWAMSCTTGLMETIFSLEQNILVFLLWDAPKKIFDSPAEPCQRACFTSTAPHFDMIAIAHCLPSSRSPSLSVGLNAPLNPLANLLANLLAKWIANSNKPLLNSYIKAIIMLTC